MTLLLICLSIPFFLYLYAEFSIKESFTRWFKVPVSSGMIGIEVASKLLERYGLRDVKIELVSGELTDYYDWTNKKMALSKDVYYGDSLASVAVLAHEIGHALQDRQNDFRLYDLSKKAKPVAVLLGSITPFLFIFGLIVWKWMIGLAIISILFVILVQLLVLLIEQDASRRAKLMLLENGFVTQKEMLGVNQTLSAAALTYVAAIFRWNV